MGKKKIKKEQRIDEADEFSWLFSARITAMIDNESKKNSSGYAPHHRVRQILGCQFRVNRRFALPVIGHVRRIGFVQYNRKNGLKLTPEGEKQVAKLRAMTGNTGDDM